MLNLIINYSKSHNKNNRCIRKTTSRQDACDAKFKGALARVSSVARCAIRRVTSVPKWTLAPVSMFPAHQWGVYLVREWFPVWTTSFPSGGLVPCLNSHRCNTKYKKTLNFVIQG